jgi:hypothetical protein
VQSVYEGCATKAMQLYAVFFVSLIIRTPMSHVRVMLYYQTLSLNQDGIDISLRIDR